ncbi:MAG: hypothetical protein ABJF10_05210 [Chthoniobacter sp.]|uniref:hypothetical protein n=1 Tax=Chthoniobacter sp. TaxID=2510640 RepID=UPI0032A191A1
MFRNHYRRGECRDCGTECVLRRRVPRHELHLALTIATVGFWGFCWIITVIAARWEPWRCTDCRRPQAGDPARDEAPEQSATEAGIGSNFGLVHEHSD